MGNLLPYIDVARKTHRDRKVKFIHNYPFYINRNRANKTFQSGDVVLLMDVAIAVNKWGCSCFRYNQM